MQIKSTVQRAYLFNDNHAKRVLAHSNGAVFDGLTWVQPRGNVILHPGDAYERWTDVPRSWLSKVPFWK